MPVARLVIAGLLLSGWTARAADKVVWRYDVGGLVNGVEPLPSGDVLIPDKLGNRIIEVLPTRPVGGSIVWELDGLGQPDHVRSLPNGDVLVADTLNAKVARYAHDKTLLWFFGDGSTGCTATSLAFPGDLSLAENGDYLIADQTHNRVLQTNSSGSIVWQYGDPGCVAGLGDDQLQIAFHVEALGGGNILIASGAEKIVRVVSQTLPTGGPIVWQYGTPGVSGSGVNLLEQPERAHLLANGNYLIADAGGSRVIEVTPTLPAGGNIVWQWGVTDVPGSADGFLDFPYEAQRLANGNTLIADHGNGRVVEISPLRLVLGGPNIAAGVCSPAQSVTVEDTYDQVSPAVADVPVALDSTGGLLQFFADAACTQPFTFANMAAGQTQLAFFILATAQGTAAVQATASGYVTGSATVQIQGTAFRFTTPPRSLRRDECSPQALTVELVDELSSPLAIRNGALSVSLSSTSPTTVFFSDASCATPVTAASLEAGQSEIGFFVRDPARGTAVISAAATGITSGEQTLEVGSPGHPLRVGGACAAGTSTAPMALAALLGLSLLIRRR